jgi:hypothetical protein
MHVRFHAGCDNCILAEAKEKRNGGVKEAYDELGNRKHWNEVASREAMWMARKNNKLNQYSSWQNSHPLR